jgi:hypothetical protein
MVCGHAGSPHKIDCPVASEFDCVRATHPSHTRRSLSPPLVPPSPPPHPCYPGAHPPPPQQPQVAEILQGGVVRAQVHAHVVTAQDEAEFWVMPGEEGEVGLG